MDRKNPDEFIWRVFCIGSKSGSNRVQIPLANTLYASSLNNSLCIGILSCIPRDRGEKGSKPTPQGYLFDSGARPLSPRLILRIVILVTSSKAKATSVIQAQRQQQSNPNIAT